VFAVTQANGHERLFGLDLKQAFLFDRFDRFRLRRFRQLIAADAVTAQNRGWRQIGPGIGR
jgi:hypothetical protein